MPTVTQTTHAVRRPGNDMGYAGCDLLLAARAPVGLACALARHAPDQKFPVAGAVRFLAAERREATLGGFGPRRPAPAARTVPAHGSMGATGHS